MHCRSSQPHSSRLANSQDMIRQGLSDHMDRQGIQILCNNELTSITKYALEWWAKSDVRPCCRAALDGCLP